MSKHLETRQNCFEGYFCPEYLNQEPWVLSPFSIDMNIINDEDLIKDYFFDMRSKEVLQAEFIPKNVSHS